jgi:hypothetical protein
MHLDIVSGTVVFHDQIVSRSVVLGGRGLCEPELVSGDFEVVSLFCVSKVASRPPDDELSMLRILNQA